MRRSNLRYATLLVLLAGGVASAVTWTGAGSEPYWDIPANWDTGAAPTASDTANVNNVLAADGVSLPYPTIYTLKGATDTCNNLYVGVGGTGTLEMVGGRFEVGTYLRIGVNAGDVGVFNMRGGDIVCLTKEPEIARNGIGTLNMTGGSITVALSGRNFWLGSISDPANFGLLNMDGGTITTPGYISTRGAGHLRMAGGKIICGGILNVGESCQYNLYGGSMKGSNLTINSGNNVDLAGGMLFLGANTNLATYVSDGRLTAWGGLGTVVITDVNTAGVMTYEVTGTADAAIMAKAWQPSPANKETLFVDQATLTWVAGKGADSQKVYFGKDPEALTLLTSDPNQGALSVDFHTTVTDLSLGTTYYWRVDAVAADARVTTGDLWSFGTLSLKLAKVVYPLPEATGVETTGLVLQWEAGQGAINHDVYFGTDAANLALVSEDQTATTYAVPGTLILGQTYYWRLDEFDGTDTHTGLVTSFTTTAPAGSLVWDNGGDDSLWSNPLNWSTDSLPGVGSQVDLFDPSVCLIDANTAAYCSTFRGPAWNSNPAWPTLEITGGTLNILAGDWTSCRNAGSMGYMKMTGGVVNAAQIWYCGWHGDMWVDMTGGEINVAGDMQLPRSYSTTGKGTFNLHGGVLNVGSLSLSNPDGVPASASYDQSLLDITEGVLILSGNKVAVVNDFVAKGQITAWGGEGTIVSGYDAEADKTTVRACLEMLQADFNADCVVDELDRDLLMSDWGYVTPTASVWDHNMSTDPVGSDPFDLKIRNANNGNYRMDEEAGTLEVTGALLLDRNIQPAGTFDTDLHFIAKAQSPIDDPLKFWLQQGMVFVLG